MTRVEGPECERRWRRLGKSQVDGARHGVRSSATSFIMKKFQGAEPKPE